MIPVAFDYLRPRTLAEASTALAAARGEACVLAGGQSLMTDLKLRRLRPRMVLDLQAIPGLSSVDVHDGFARIGAMARQADVVENQQVVSRFPLLAEIAGVAADPMVRRRGTLVGALCAAEQGGDWLAGCLALDGVIELARSDSSRELPLTEFVRAAGTTALGGEEIAVAVRLPFPPPGARSTYRKIKHISIGWSIASVAAVLDLDGGGRCRFARVAVSGATSHPQRLPALEGAVMNMDAGDHAGLRDAIAASLATVSFWGDHYASAGYRAERLARLLFEVVADLAGAPRKTASADSMHGGTK